jgi:hypothetical protein
MKVGDIVYFKSQYIALYGCKGGSYEYYFKPGDRYRIDDLNDRLGVRTGSITNLEDGTHHFAHSSICERLITVEENRELQLDKIGI